MLTIFNMGLWEMQAFSEENSKLSKRAIALYNRLLEVQQIKSIKNKQAYIALDYELLAVEFMRSREQIRRYIVKLEKAGLVKRYSIPSDVINGMRQHNVMYVEVTKEGHNE